MVRSQWWEREENGNVGGSCSQPRLRLTRQVRRGRDASGSYSSPAESDFGVGRIET